jgi:CRISP-associated protein Cas1
MSSDAVEACCERGNPIYFLSFKGEPYAALYAAGLGGTVVTKRAQLVAFNTSQGIELGCAFAGGKIANQANLLRNIA